MGSNPVFTIVIAPDVPEEAFKSLQADFEKAIDDPNYVVVLGHDIIVQHFEPLQGNTTFVTAPDVPETALEDVRLWFSSEFASRFRSKYFMVDNPNLLMLNFHVYIQQIPLVN